jgi:hypothetical protein
MKCLDSQMAGLKLRLLDQVVQASNLPPPNVEPLSHETIQNQKMIICRAVEDRICKRMDLASRTDLTERQTIDALRLLLKIARESDLRVNFSPAEFYLLIHGCQLQPLESAPRCTLVPKEPVLQGRLE